MNKGLIIKNVLVILSLTFLTMTTQAQWLSGYYFKRAITILPNQIPNGAVLTDFPMLIDITGSYLLNESNGGNITNSSGYDLVFSVDNVSILDHDIIHYEGTTTGEYKAWIRVPSIQDGTIIYMYYGNSSISSDPSTSSTWGNN